MPKEKTSVLCAQESAGALESVLKSGQWETVRSELEFALKEVKKAIPAKPIRESWAPNLCPTCDADLGGDSYDGYYQNPYFEMCPECRQTLDYQ